MECGWGNRDSKIGEKNERQGRMKSIRGNNNNNFESEIDIIIRLFLFYTPCHQITDFILIMKTINIFYFWNNVWYIYIFLMDLTYSIIFIVQVDKKE